MHKNDKMFSPLIDQAKTSAPSTGGRPLRNWRQRSGRGRHLYQGAKSLDQHKGAAGEGPPTRRERLLPHSCVTWRLAWGPNKPSRGGGLPGLGLKLSCLRVGAERLQPDVAKVNTEPMFKPAPMDILTDSDAWQTVEPLWQIPLPALQAKFVSILPTCALLADVIRFAWFDQAGGSWLFCSGTEYIMQDYSL